MWAFMLLFANTVVIVIAMTLGVLAAGWIMGGLIKFSESSWFGTAKSRVSSWLAPATSAIVTVFTRVRDGVSTAASATKNAIVIPFRRTQAEVVEAEVVPASA